ncbi:hypothetical protein [Hydrogenophaga sp. 2FB]|uniref:hypothetical protein n=1 Tax=Hydrogenophaga sp. 2FB TaxID=2502187 RepID=UPI0010F7E43C|nr:hypothetical protein [Hydrogenophaga sp. 2FB]
MVAADKNVKKPGVLKRWASGFWNQQREMAYPTHLAGFNKEVFRTYKGLLSGNVAPKRVETFDAAVARQGLTEEFLSSQLEKLKNLHVAMYVIGAFVLVYAVWLAITSSLLFGGVSAFWAVGIFVRGYLYGFRAWQIQNRDLIRLQDGIRIRGTYLVL